MNDAPSSAPFPAPSAAAPTATMLAIGDELLSGRTKDRNIGHLAETLQSVGIDLVEVRIVPDAVETIAGSLNELRERATYCFTSGGIGPTHDDVTADAVSLAFGLPCEHDEAAMALLAAHYERSGKPFTEARQRMARMPRGATHIDNPVSVAPGFRIGNVYVMAGVPSVFTAMLDAVLPTLAHGAAILSESVAVPAGIGEGDLAGPLAAIDAAHGQVSIGSYPRFEDGRHTVRIVLRGRDMEAVEAARQAVTAMLSALAGRTPPL